MKIQEFSARVLLAKRTNARTVTFHTRDLDELLHDILNAISDKLNKPEPESDQPTSVRIQSEPKRW